MPEPAPNAIDDSLFTALGRVAYTWSFVEAIEGEFLAFLLQANQGLAHVITKNVSGSTIMLSGIALSSCGASRHLAVLGIAPPEPFSALLGWPADLVPPFDPLAARGTLPLLAETMGDVAGLVEALTTGAGARPDLPVHSLCPAALFYFDRDQCWPADPRARCRRSLDRPTSGHLRRTCSPRFSPRSLLLTK